MNKRPSHTLMMMMVGRRVVEAMLLGPHRAVSCHTTCQTRGFALRFAIYCESRRTLSLYLAYVKGHHVNDEKELQRLGGMFRDLRETRAAASEESACRWDEHKFAASRR